MDFSIREADGNDADAIAYVVRTVLEEYGLAFEPEGTDRDLAEIPANYQGGGGTFRVIESPRTGVVGCGGLFPTSPDELELRKMYLLPSARGQGLGKKMLRDFIEHARELAVSRITLETASVLEEAIALYQSFGFARMTRDGLAPRCDQAWELRILRAEPEIRLTRR